MAYLVAGKYRNNLYAPSTQTASCLVTQADNKDEARELGRQKIARQSGRLATVDRVEKLHKPDEQSVPETDFDDPWYEQTLVAFDCETTGLHASEREMVELGFAVRQDDEWDVTSFLLGDADEVPPDASDINGIYTEDIEGEPTLEEVFDTKVRPFLENADALIAQNRGFDAAFLFEAMRDRGLEAPLPPIFCTLEMARQFDPGADSHSLQEMAPQLDVDPEDAHRAGDDARVCGEVFIELARRLDYFLPPCTMRDAIRYFDDTSWKNEPDQVELVTC